MLRPFNALFSLSTLSLLLPHFLLHLKSSLHVVSVDHRAGEPVALNLDGHGERGAAAVHPAAGGRVLPDRRQGGEGLPPERGGVGQAHEPVQQERRLVQGRLGRNLGQVRKKKKKSNARSERC